MEPDADDGTLTNIEEALFNAEITEEVLTSIKKLKASKSAGQDGILFFHDTLMPIMLSLFNIIFDNRVLPDCWNSALIVPIHKKVMSMNLQTIAASHF